jgi:hypothetical protein
MIRTQYDLQQAIKAFNKQQAQLAAQELRDRLYPQPEQTQHQLDIDALFV